MLDSGIRHERSAAVTRLLETDSTAWMNQVSKILGQSCLLGSDRFNQLQLFGNFQELGKIPSQKIGGRRVLKLTRSQSRGARFLNVGRRLLLDRAASKSISSACLKLASLMNGSSLL